MPPNDDTVGGALFSLGPHRIRTRPDDTPPDLDAEPVAYFEVVWGAEAYGWNAVIRDIEDMRQGGDGKELAAPRTDYEREMMIRHVRAAANDMAQVFNRPDLVRPEDDLE